MTYIATLIHLNSSTHIGYGDTEVEAILNLSNAMDETNAYGSDVVDQFIEVCVFFFDEDAESCEVWEIPIETLRGYFEALSNDEKSELFKDLMEWNEDDFAFTVEEHDFEIVKTQSPSEEVEEMTEEEIDAELDKVDGELTDIMSKYFRLMFLNSTDKQKRTFLNAIIDVDGVAELMSESHLVSEAVFQNEGFDIHDIEPPQ